MKKKLIALSLIVAVIGLLIGGYFIFKPKPEKGEKTVTIEIVADGKFEAYSAEVNTDELYLEGLLVRMTDNKFYNIKMTTETGAYGLYITGFFGFTADEAQHEYFSLYVNGEYGMYGISDQPIINNTTYKIVLESW